MAKRKRTKAKGKRSSIRVDVKVGILHTIANAIYSTPAGKIREAIANSRDKNATWVIITVDRATRSIYIFDNGSGITKERFHEIFEAIGYGFGRDVPEEKLSYFGLGLMSIFQLGKKVEVFTRPKGKSQILKLEVDTDAIFKEENEKKSISALSSCFKLREKSNEASRKEASANLLNENLESGQFKNGWGSFTEIIIRDIKPEDLEVICGDAFTDELSKWLPLKVERNEPFLKRLTGSKGKEIKKILENEDFCKTIDVYFGIQEEAEINQIWKYFPSFRSDLTFPDDNVYLGTSEDGEFAYYLVHSVAVDLERGGDVEERETGFWIRNQNFLVKSADFLEKPGPGRKTKTIDKPLKAWVFGEIFHKNMNRFLTVSRNDFLFDKADFRKFQEEVVRLVSPLNQELRTINEKRRKILVGLVEPFTKLREREGPIQETEKRLREIMQHDGTEEEFRQEVRKYLKKARNKSIEREEARVDVLLRQMRKPVTIGQDENAIVKIDPNLPDMIEDCDIAWDAKNKRIVALLSPDLFKPSQTVFLGEAFELVFVAQKEAAAGVSVDIDGKKIWINPFNEELVQYTVSIFDVYLALQIANAISQNKDELVKNALALLGARSDVTTRYITPLGDDLRRTLELVRRGA